MAGLILIGYILPGDYGARLRKASASLVVEALKANRDRLNAIYTGTPSQYQSALKKVKVNLPVDSIQEILQLMGTLRSSSALRSLDGKYSVLDFLGNIANKGNPWESWKRLLAAHPEIADFCGEVRLPRADGRPNPHASHITTEIGMISIAYLLPGEYGDRIREVSADLTVRSVKAFFEQRNALFANKEFTVKRLQAITRMHRTEYVIEAVKRDFDEGLDWIQEGGDVVLRESVFYSLALFLRGKRGTDIASLPDVLTVEARDAFRCRPIPGLKSKKNRRCGECPGQLELF